MKSSALFLILLAGLASSPQLLRAAEPGANQPAPSCCAAKQPSRSAPACTDKSLYQLESTWTTDQGKPFKLGNLAGKPQVILMFFSRCTAACPMLLNDLKRINAALTPKQRARVGFTLVSFDTEHDTPSTLAAYRQAWSLPDREWTLLSGQPDDVQELAALLGVQYRQTGAGQFAHSNVITVLNAKGEIVHQQVGLNEDVTGTVQKLAGLAGL